VADHVGEANRRGWILGLSSADPPTGFNRLFLRIQWPSASKAVWVIHQVPSGAPATEHRSSILLVWNGPTLPGRLMWPQVGVATPASVEDSEVARPAPWAGDPGPRSEHEAIEPEGHHPNGNHEDEERHWPIRVKRFEAERKHDEQVEENLEDNEGDDVDRESPDRPQDPLFLLSIPSHLAG
jgi:hypothetical protein